MIEIRDVTSAACALESTTGPAIVRAAVDVACSATGWLIGQSHELPSLGCSAAVVSLDGAYAELGVLDGIDGKRHPLARDIPDDAVEVITALLVLLTAPADALRRVIGDDEDHETTLVCTRAVVQLERAARLLRDDLA